MTTIQKLEELAESNRVRIIIEPDMNGASCKIQVRAPRVGSDYIDAGYGRGWDIETAIESALRDLK